MRREARRQRREKREGREGREQDVDVVVEGEDGDVGEGADVAEEVGLRWRWREEGGWDAQEVFVLRVGFQEGGFVQGEVGPGEMGCGFGGCPGGCPGGRGGEDWRSRALQAECVVRHVEQPAVGHGDIVAEEGAEVARWGEDGEGGEGGEGG